MPHKQFSPPSPLPLASHALSALLLTGIASLTVGVPLALAQGAAMTVTTAPARQAERANLISVSGFIRPWDEASIDAQIGGIPIVSAPVRVGDFVRKGEILARFDATAMRARLAGAEAALAEAGANAIDAIAKRDRALRLSSSDLLSRQQMLDISTRATMAEAKLQVARAAVVRARLDLAHTLVLAPDSGLISSRTLTLGQVATLGMPLYRLIRQDRLQWHPELTGSQLDQVHPGMKVQVNLPGGLTAAGAVHEVAPSVAPGTQIGLAYADLSVNPAVRAGMYVGGTIEIGMHPVVLVPSASIIVAQGHTYAVEADKGRARLLRVKLAREGRNITEVLSGVSPGAAMVTQGAGLLSEGEPVRIAATAGAPR